MAKIDYAALKKGGFMRQKQKGYFSLRIQVVGGNLTSENIRAVADVADKYGKGYVHMTSRQGVEIPFINFENMSYNIPALMEGHSFPHTEGEAPRTRKGRCPHAPGRKGRETCRKRAKPEQRNQSAKLR